MARFLQTNVMGNLHRVYFHDKVPLKLCYVCFHEILMSKFLFQPVLSEQAIKSESQNSPLPQSQTSTEIPKAMGVVPKLDLLQPLRSEENIDEEVDLSELNLKCETNEFGALEVITPANSTQSTQNPTSEADDSDLDLICRETVQTTPPKPPAPSVSIPVTDPKVSKEVPAKKDLKVKDDEILCCGGCGCYGMAGEFFNTEACSNSCQNRIVQKNREKEKKERELAIQKQRREQRKKEQREAKEKEQKVTVTKTEPNQEDSEEDDDDEDAADEDEESVRLPFDSPHPWLDNVKGFSWTRYLECTNSRGAPAKLFNTPYPPGPNFFKVGHRLEAIDSEHPALICVASVAQVQGFRILVHFDGFSRAHDFWENANSPNLFPVGWCETHKQKLMPPPGLDLFSWKSYLESNRFQAAPKEAFYHFARPHKPNELNGWKIGLKLEAVDRSNTSLVCVATITNVMDGRVLIHFDGWDLDYDYWVTPSSPYIHPKGIDHVFLMTFLKKRKKKKKNRNFLIFLFMFRMVC